MSTPADEGDLARPLASGIVPEEMVIKTETWWFWVVIGVLAVIVGVVTVTAATNHLHPPSSAETLDPAAIYRTAEFSESNLGTAINVDGSATVRMIAQQYSFSPQCVTIPFGPHVTFRVATADVVHGFIIAGTNINTMVVPGYISVVAGSFPAAGTYPMLCHEFCGVGHAGMAAQVRVLPPGRFPDLSRLTRLRCAKE